MVEKKKKTKKYLINVATPADHNIKIKVIDKLMKYTELPSEVSGMRNVQVTSV